MSREIVITISGNMPETWDKDYAEDIIRKRLFGTPFEIEKIEEVNRD